VSQGIGEKELCWSNGESLTKGIDRGDRWQVSPMIVCIKSIGVKRNVGRGVFSQTDEGSLTDGGASVKCFDVTFTIGEWPES